MTSEKNGRANCIDIMAISKGLEKRISNYTLDTKHEWSPAATHKIKVVLEDNRRHRRWGTFVCVLVFLMQIKWKLVIRRV